MFLVICTILISINSISATDSSDVVGIDDLSLEESNQNDITITSNEIMYENSNEISNKINEITNDNEIVINDSKDTLNNSQISSDKLSSSSNKIDPVLLLSDFTIQKNQSISFFVILPEDATGKVAFKINQKTISPEIRVEDGFASYDYVIPYEFNNQYYQLNVVYGGNSIYNVARVNSTLTLVKNSELKNVSLFLNNYTAKYNSSVTFKATMAPYATGSVVFKINRNSIGKAKIINGTATLTYQLPDDVLPKRYRLDVYFPGDYVYTNSSLYSYLTIVRYNSTAVVNNVSSKAGSNTKFSSVIKDEKGNFLSNVTVVYKLNQVTIGNNTTDSKGYSELNYVLPSSFDNKEYSINIVSGTTRTVYGTRQNATLTMGTLKTTSSIINATAKPGNTVIITSTIIDENKNYVLSGYGKLYINGKYVDSIAVQNGFIRYSYKLPANTTDKVSLRLNYYGTWKYKNSSAVGMITINQINTITTADAVLAVTGSPTKMNAKVVDQYQNKITGGYVIFSVSGKVVGNSSVINGSASYTYNVPLLAAGKYKVLMNYTGTDVYKASSDDNILNVSRINTTVSGKSYISSRVGELLAINVSVLDSSRYNVDSGKVSVYLNGTFIGNATVSKGVATLKYSLPIKYESRNVSYRVDYIQNDIYRNSTFSGKIFVAKRLDVYVSPSGNDNNAGNSSSPYKTIKTAVKHVSLLGNIHLAAGTYNESGITITQSVKIIGVNPSKTVINGMDKGTPIISNNLTTVSISISNLTLKNGSSTKAYSAGAISSSGKLIIENVSFISNVGKSSNSAGAIYNIGELNVTNSLFENNRALATNTGGAAIRSSTNTTKIIGSTFKNNSINSLSNVTGGAIYASKVNLTVYNSTFTNNSVSGVNVIGGAIETINGNVTISNVKFISNKVNSTNTTRGGAIGNLYATMIVDNSTFDSNMAISKNLSVGGALYSEYAYTILNDLTFKNNQANATTAYGGATYLYYAYTNITNVNYTNNHIIAKNEAIGGAIYQRLGNLTVLNASLEKNTAKGNVSYAAGLYFEGTKLDVTYSNFTANNATATNSSVGAAVFTGTNATFNHVDFINNTVNAPLLGGGAIGNLKNLIVTNSNFISNNASNMGNAITSSGNVTINSNYWGSDNPNWNSLLHGVTAPASYSKTIISHKT